MTSYVILSGADVLELTKDKPVVIYIDGKPHTLCTDEYFEKETGVKMNRADREGGMTNGDVIKAIFPGCRPIEGTLLIDTDIAVFEPDWWKAPYKRTEG